MGASAVAGMYPPSSFDCCPDTVHSFPHPVGLVLCCLCCLGGTSLRLGAARRDLGAISVTSVRPRWDLGTFYMVRLPSLPSLPSRWHLAATRCDSLRLAATRCDSLRLAAILVKLLLGF